jgi:MoxR-like ATPase
MLKLRVTYPDREAEKLILRRMAGRPLAPMNRVASAADIMAVRAAMGELYVDEKIEDYIVDLVHASRNPLEYGMMELVPLIEYGASPRATINLAICSRALAFLRGRGYVLPEDVKSIAPDVLRHRIITSFEADAEEITSDDVVDRILSTVPVP